MIPTIFKINLPKNRVYGLDILRASAIIFVLISHSKSYLPDQLQKVFTFIQLDGVTIFFVLSGFLIGNILIKNINDNKSIFTFWVRRWFRTIPNYFLILTLVLLLSYYYNPNFGLKNHLNYYIFSQNILTEQPVLFTEAWSLSVEEWFYMLLPIVIFSMVKILKINTQKTIIITSLLIICLAFIYRFQLYLSVNDINLSEWGLVFRKKVATRIDSIMFGVLGAYIYTFKKEFWIKNKNILLLFGIFILMFTHIYYTYFYYNSKNDFYDLFLCVIYFTSYPISVLFMLPFFLDIKYGKGKISKVITYTSVVSYSLYLINLTLIKHLVLNKIKWNSITPDFINIDILNYILFWSLTFVISILLYKYFELPMMKLRDSKIFSKSSK